jgi:hypothetical protein
MASAGITSFKDPRSLAGLVAKLPAVFLPDEKAAERFFGFFTGHLRNRNTQRAFYKAACRFADWCERMGLPGLRTTQLYDRRGDSASLDENGKVVDLSGPNVTNVIVDGILKPIHLLLDNGYWRAALVLLYSGMDAMAFMSLPEGKNAVTRKNYLGWAEQYIRFPCREQVTGLELYAARCGVLHTFTPDSELSRENRVRRIIYVSHHMPEVSYDAVVARNVVLVSVEGLFEAFTKGMEQFLEDLLADSAKRELSLKRLAEMFHHIPYE